MLSDDTARVAMDMREEEQRTSFLSFCPSQSDHFIICPLMTTAKSARVLKFCFFALKEQDDAFPAIHSRQASLGL